jgi:hypothetical protein
MLGFTIHHANMLVKYPKNGTENNGKSKIQDLSPEYSKKKWALRAFIFAIVSQYNENDTILAGDETGAYRTRKSGNGFVPGCFR